MTKPSSPSKAWSGRFTSATHEFVEAFSASIDTDKRLWRHDLLGTKAHIAMLAKVGLLTQDEHHALFAGIEELTRKFEHQEIPWRQNLEDIHMHIEHELTQKLGKIAQKLHTGRSRNDQVATTLRLWTRDALTELADSIVKLMNTLVTKAHDSQGIIIPGYTHMQRAQPVSAAHYLLAHANRLKRDYVRLCEVKERLNECPLGSGALAGSTLPLDRFYTSAILKFDKPTANSLDGASDRDFVCDSLYAFSMIAIHLSSLAEEWILWNSSEFSFIDLPDELCTGSSIMPQKKNPDVLELMRGKSGRIIGALQGMLVLLKGLPLAYNRDLQEDKELLFSSFDTIKSSIFAATLIAEGLRFNQEKIEKSLNGGFLDATAVMEYLIKKGVPMREAHHIIGKLVGTAIQREKQLGELSLEDLRSAHPSLGQDAPFGAMKAAAAFMSYGSASKESIKTQFNEWSQFLEGKKS